MTVLAPTHPTRPPRDGLVRALRPGIELRSEGKDEPPVLFGHFAVFNRWTEIDSWFEGNFMERIAPGAFKKTFKEQRQSMRLLLNHGRDPEIGDKPIGAIKVLREDDEGGYYEADLFDGLSQLVLDGLRADQYGASFRFRVVREEFNEDPGTSEDNPKGIAERTIKEMQVFEFGPVTFPAYSEASAGVRSLTDAYFFGRLASTPPDELRSLFVEARDLAPVQVQVTTGTTTGTTGVTFTTTTAASSEDEDEDRTVVEQDESAEDSETETRDGESEMTDQTDTETRSDDDEDETAVPGQPTPLNTTIPRSKRRGNLWVLPAPRSHTRSGQMPGPKIF